MALLEDTVRVSLVPPASTEGAKVPVAEEEALGVWRPDKCREWYSRFDPQALNIVRLVRGDRRGT